MIPLKVDLHIHTKEDREDRISYSARELIDEAVARGFDALAITNHNTVTFSPKLASYATKRGVVLIPGVEAEKTPEAIIQAIKAGRVKPVSQPLTLDVLIGIFARIAMTKRLSFKGAMEIALTWMAFLNRVFDGQL